MQPRRVNSGSAFKPTTPPVLDPHNKRMPCATQHFVPSLNAVTSGEPLPNKDGSPLGPQLFSRDGCNAENVFDASVITDVNVTTALKKMLTTR